MGVCNKVAGAIAPLLLVGAVVKSPNEIDEVQKSLTTVSAEQQAIILNNLSCPSCYALCSYRPGIGWDGIGY